MTEQYGYAGEILRVDLASDNIDRIPTANYSSRFLGGRGIAAGIYWEEVTPECSAFDPGNIRFLYPPLS